MGFIVSQPCIFITHTLTKSTQHAIQHRARKQQILFLSSDFHHMELVTSLTHPLNKQIIPLEATQFLHTEKQPLQDIVKSIVPLILHVHFTHRTFEQALFSPGKKLHVAG